MTELNGTLSEHSTELPYDYAVIANDSANHSWYRDLVNLLLVGVIALCAVGLLLLLAVPILAVVQSVLGMNLPGVNNVIQWLSGGFKGLILVITLTVTGSVSYLYLRHRLLHNRELYSVFGCPQCREQELIRVRRQKSDRLIARLGVPVRRYVCRNCSWDGLLISGAYPGEEKAGELAQVSEEIQWPSIWEINAEERGQQEDIQDAAVHVPE